MSENTKIEWADHTFNPWTGCTKISPACDHCYAESWAKRSGTVQWGPHAERRRTTPANWSMPKRWNAQAGAFQAQHGRRQRVFCASLADWADNAVPIEWLVDLLELVRTTPNLDWLLLTKRIGNARSRIDQAHSWALDHWPSVDVQPLSQWLGAWLEGNEPPANAWLGATICDQAEADRDIPRLLAVPACVRFLSVEPMLGPVDLDTIYNTSFGEGQPYLHPLIGRVSDGHGDSCSAPAIDWVICGGESGPHARPMHPDWARSLRDQCAVAGVPFLFKQWGEHTAHAVDPESYASHLSCIDREGRECALSRGDQARRNGEGWWFLPPHPGRGTWGPDGIPDGVVEVRRPGKKTAGRLLDGRTHDGFPEAHHGA